MTRWFNVCTELLHDPIVQLLDADTFKRKMIEALSGEENEFSPHIKGPYIRPPAHEWRSIRAKIFERDDYTCTYCGNRGGKLECDHIVPVCLGGTHDPENLTTACMACNRSKAGKTLSEWRR